MKNFGIGGAKVAGGYFVSTLVAAVVAAVVLSAARYKTPDMFIAIMTLGFIYTVMSAWPGYLLTLLVARWFRLTHAAYFGATGGANALLSWVLLNSITSATVPVGGELMWACVAGGMAGGIAYWAMQRVCDETCARRDPPQRAKPALSAAGLPGLRGQNLQGER